MPHAKIRRWNFSTGLVLKLIKCSFKTAALWSQIGQRKMRSVKASFRLKHDDQMKQEHWFPLPWLHRHHLPLSPYCIQLQLLPSSSVTGTSPYPPGRPCVFFRTLLCHPPLLLCLSSLPVGSFCSACLFSFLFKNKESC